MSQVEESLEEKIARIRKQNEAIIKRARLIEEDIKNAERNNATVKLKPTPAGESEYGSTLYADKIVCEKRFTKPVENFTREEKFNIRKNVKRENKEDDWRQERKQIDQERINRQKATSGSWRREWDADKIVLNDDSAEIKKDKFNKNFKNEKQNNRNFSEQTNFTYNQKEQKDFYNSKPINRRKNDNTDRETIEWKKINYDKFNNFDNSRLRDSFNTLKPNVPFESNLSNSTLKTENKGVRYSRWRDSQNLSSPSSKTVEQNVQNPAKLVELNSSDLKNIKKTINCDNSIEPTFHNINNINFPIKQTVQKTEHQNNAYENIVIHLKSPTAKFPSRQVHMFNELPDVESLKITNNSENTYNSMTFERSDLKQYIDSQNIGRMNIKQCIDPQHSINSIVTQAFSNSKIARPIANDNPRKHNCDNNLKPEVKISSNEDGEWEDVSDGEWEDVSEEENEN